MSTANPLPVLILERLNRGSLVACDWQKASKPPYDDAIGGMEPAKKQLRFRAVFNFSRRHCLKIESLVPPAAQRESDGNYCLKGRKPVRGAKESFPGAKDAPRVERNQRRAEANQFHRRAFSSEIGENPYADPYALLISAGSGASDAYGQ